MSVSAVDSLRPLDVLHSENKRLQKDLKICEKLLENYRNCLLVFNKNCNCVENDDIRDKLNKLETYYKVFDVKIVSKCRPNAGEETAKSGHTDDGNEYLVTDRPSMATTDGQALEPTASSDAKDDTAPAVSHRDDSDKSSATEALLKTVDGEDGQKEDNPSDCDEELASLMRRRKRGKKAYFKRVLTSLASDEEDESAGSDDIDLEVELGAGRRTAPVSARKAKNYACDWDGCDKKYSKEWELTAHYRHNHSKEKPFKCSDCSKCFTIDKYLKRHKELCTGIKYQCDVRGCLFESPFKKQLKAHEMIHLADRTDASELLEMGAKRRTRAAAAKRPLAKRRTKSGGAFDDETPTDELLPAMGTTGSTAPTFDRSLLKKRLKVNAEVVCPEVGCGKVLKCKRYLHKHIQTVHLNLRPYKCAIPGCESAFKTAEALANHKASHLNERRFACDFEGCAKRFNTRHEWTQHKRRHEGRHTANMIPCEWPGCEIQCQSRPGLVEHMNRHRGIRPYQCEYARCPQAFFTKFELKHHSLKFHNEGQTCGHDYLCDFEGCHKQFITQIDLKRHKRSSHIGSFICTWPECGQRFASNYNLTGHMNRHLDIRAFRCDFVNCDRSYYGRRDLLKHINKCHSS